ncbi:MULTISPECIES: molybdopterin-dependent oxidoreductase [unclassified Mycobacterium]|uniref:molybdopterin-containing oxidoreductase family protein n=1 Tax=unclassified Mycobacterium TaxID=2642494 RepID=UPI0029C93824|nr:MULTISPECIES: molybdopterin-dependent oxidoreductase [unclassified Mycobacterium]
MPRTQHSICRVCQNSCAVLVDVDDDGLLTGVRGDPDNPVYHGYTCEKGRNAYRSYTDAGRILHSLKRRLDGQFAPVPIGQAINEVGDKLSAILDRHGPRSVALFFGTNFTLDSPLSLTISRAFMTAIGSPMTFSPETLDQPGKTIAKGMHGMWMAPGHAANRPDVALLIGNNPLVSHQGRYAAPMDFIKDIRARGGDVIVIDPRRTETAGRATMFLQPRPGQDVAIVAALINVIIAEKLYDAEFVELETTGFDVLCATVAPFTPRLVAERADVDATDLVAIARAFGRAHRGYAAAGTGPNMAAKGSLLEYLLLCLDTICGHRLRAGEKVDSPMTLIPKEAQPQKAQAMPPFPPTGPGYPEMRVRGLLHSVSGPPAAALAEEITLPGDGQIRALISVGANPANCVPDQLTLIKALRSLDLLVQTDVRMSTTASLAHYVIAPTIPYEAPCSTGMSDLYSLYADDWGYPGGYGQYAEKVVDPPAGSDVIEQWRFLFRVAQRMKLQLVLPPGLLGMGAAPDDPALELDMSKDPDIDELFAHIHRGSRVPLDVVKQHPGGAIFAEPAVYVAEKDPGWEGRLELGSAPMMSDLTAELKASDVGGERYPLRLISRRTSSVMNSRSQTLPPKRLPYNPAFLHPDDLSALHIDEGDRIVIESDHASVVAIAAADTSLRRGLVSISHNWGHVPDLDDDVKRVGTNSGALVANDGVYDQFSGQPRMSNVPVRVSPVHP